MGLALNDVPRRQESHFHERMLAAVTTLLFITILLWPLDKNFLDLIVKLSYTKRLSGVLNSTFELELINFIHVFVRLLN